MSSRKPGTVKFEDAALGTGTVSYFAEDGKSNKVHYIPKQNVATFMDGVSPYLKNKSVLYLGNSQSHSINQKKENDNTMSGYLFNDLIDSNITFLSASIPNANLQEHYLLYNYFFAKIPNLKLLIIPVFMDDLRESGIRESYFKNFTNGEFRIESASNLAQEINHSLESFNSIKTIDTATVDQSTDFNALKETTQDAVERNINKTLADNFLFWKNRANIRGEYFINLYKTRNTLLNISSQSTRKMISSRYNKNLNALKLTIELAKENNTKVLLIIPPLRQDIKYPYDLKEYTKFKDELEELAKNESLSFLNIDNIIEGKYWGYSASTQLFKDKDYDFMHFQAEAHKIIADTLKPYIFKEVL
jgi:hypothetical protein